MPTLNRRELIGSLVAGAAWSIAGCRDGGTRDASAAPSQAKPIVPPNGDVDWRAVRALFPLSPDAIHLAWMERKPLPVTRAKFVSPGGFLAYENLLGIKAAVEFHRSIGRDRIAARVRELNSAFRDGAATIPGVTLHTPRDPEVSGGLSCFEVRGLKAEEVAERLSGKRIRTNSSPYKVSYARVGAGIMNFPEDIDTTLREIRALAGTRAS